MSQDEADESREPTRDATARLEPSRRRFLSLTACAAGGVTVAAIAAPALVVVHDPLGRTTVAAGDAFVAVGPAERFAVDTPVRVELRADKRDAWSNPGVVVVGRAWVRRRADDTFEVFSSVCPHLGCEVGFTAEARRYACPCHESTFALDGAVESGPSPRSLDPLEHRVAADGTLEIRFQRFELNQQTRTALEA